MLENCDLMIIAILQMRVQYHMKFSIICPFKIANPAMRMLYVVWHLKL